MGEKASKFSEQLRHAPTPSSARRKLPRQAPTTRIVPLDEGEDGNRPVGRYDGRRAPLPPGNELGSSPREENRERLRKQVKRLRGEIRIATAAEAAATTPGKALKAMEAREYLEGELARCQEVHSGMGIGLATVGVVDPMGDGKGLIRAAVNRRVDVLEDQRSHHLISEGAYRTGRIVQTIFEQLGKVGGSNWCGASRVDAALANELKMIRTLESAATIQDLMDRIRGRLGEIDTRLLRRVLGDCMSFADCAALVGKSGDRGQRYIAQRYRDALEELTAAWTFRGAVQPTPDDKHAAAAAAAEERQDAAIAAGATLQRLEGELVDLEAGAPIGEGLVRSREINRTKEAIAGGRLGQAMARSRRALPSGR